VAVFSTVPALLEELKRLEAETVAMLAALPAGFVARKRTYGSAATCSRPPTMSGFT